MLNCNLLLPGRQATGRWDRPHRKWKWGREMKGLKVLFLSIKIKKVGETKGGIFLVPAKLNCSTCGHCISNVHMDQKHHTINEWKKNPSRTNGLTYSSWFKKFLSYEAGQTLEQVVQSGYDGPSVLAGTAALAWCLKCRHFCSAYTESPGWGSQI